MPTLFPPEYPDCPDAPLLAFGPSFSEELSRSVILTVVDPADKSQLDVEVRVAAALTMLEGFHPRDHVECLLSAQGVGYHVALMDSLARANRPDTPLPVAIKLRSNAAQLGRAFSLILRDLERRQSKPLPERPPAVEPPAPNAPRPSPPPPDPRDDGGDPDGRPEDIDVRPDGTPGSLAAYAPKPAEEVFIPREPLIMRALASRPKPWRMVNTPNSAPEPPPAEPEPEPFPVSGPPPIGLTEAIRGGDALARYASARLDPDAPVEPPNFDDEDSVVELELISTGGDPEAEAARREMAAAHPEGKPIRILRYGTKPPPDD